jgi:hypothetical protein
VRRLSLLLVPLAGLGLLWVLLWTGHEPVDEPSSEAPGSSESVTAPASAEATGEPVAEAEIALPPGTLSAKELRRLFRDRTVLSRTVVQERESFSYYHPDGEVRQLRDGQKRYGRWRVLKNGRICLQMEQLPEKCRIVALQPDGSYRKFVVKRNGDHQPSVDYVRFWPGNPYNI